MFSLSKMANDEWGQKSNREALMFSSVMITIIPTLLWFVIGLTDGRPYVLKPLYYYPIGLILTFIFTGLIKLSGNGKDDCRGWLLGLVVFWPGLWISCLGCLLWAGLVKLWPVLCGLHNGIAVAHEKISEMPRLFMKRPKLLEDKPMLKLTSEYRNNQECEHCHRPL